MEKQESEEKTITARGDKFTLTIWRDGARLKAKLFDKDNEVVDNFELKLGDILSQAGINLNEILGDALPGPLGWAVRHIH